jgi:hypothetical protein
VILDSRKQKSLAGVVIDTGTNRRIPKVIWFDVTTGDYEQHLVAPNGHDVLMDEWGKPIVRRGRAVGKLELVPIDQAANIGVFRRPPEKVHQAVQPLSKDEKVAGLEMYKEVYVKVNHEFRRLDRKTVESKWVEYLRKSPFLDNLCLRRNPVPVRVLT